MSTNIPYKSGPYVSGYVTPDNKASEGFNSVGKHNPAPWLPLLRFNQEQREYVVISRQKPVAFVDGLLVPAGYRFEYEAIKKGEAATIFYTQIDVTEGVKNYKGEDVKVGEAVLQSVVDSGDQPVSYFVGIVNYDAFREPGGDAFNPTTLRSYNFNPQATVSFNMDYHYEYPLVKDDADYAKAPYVAVTAFIGQNVKAGQFVTYDKNSNFIVTSEDFTQGSVAKEAILGQVTKVHVVKDPDTKKIVQSIGALERVVSPSNISNNPLDETPNVRNGGMTQKLEYANGYGFVHFGLQTR